ncbi:ABC transporter ATP-binding protein [Candidatus Leptofilum sp.]|uniref:ABC transporter ATP-binding protein n=1 Tax=Candidatus Leptofilum sp. TaxID=3241576 RepID=UPI003B59FF50
MNSLDIRVSSLIHRYDATHALQNINLHIQTGEFVSLIGVSGCGKSTLMRLIAGLQLPTEGSVWLDGQPPAVARAAKQIGWMAQQAALLPWRTVLENVQLAQKINPQQNAETMPQPHELLKMVGLAEFADVYPLTLSGGMQQRAALARTLATGAAVWLMDEPFAALDELTRELLAEELLQLWQQFRPTVLWITHNLHEAIRLSDRVLAMTPRPGTIAGEIAVPLSRPRDDTSAQFQTLLRQARALLRQERVHGQ